MTKLGCFASTAFIDLISGTLLLNSLAYSYCEAGLQQNSLTAGVKGTLEQCVMVSR